MDDVGLNRAGGKSGKKTAMDYALDQGKGNFSRETLHSKNDVLMYLAEKGERRIHVRSGIIGADEMILRLVLPLNLCLSVNTQVYLLRSAQSNVTCLYL